MRQFDTDPDVALNPYEWLNGQLRLVTILPNGEAAPGGGSLPTNRAAQPIASDDGRSVLFNAAGYSDLFLRIDAEQTINVSTSQKTGSPGPALSVGSAGMAADGSKIIFTSTSELTDDAYTGRTSGVPNNKGSDLYSYDVETGDLTDLTVDHEPADKETGAGVEHVVGASRDASYIYFIASGKLAPGGTSGSRNIYVEHDGEIKFVATNPVGTFETGFPFYVTPNGLYAGFMTNEPQTGYDNAGHTEVYKYTYNGALECASCRPDGEPPNGDAAIGRPGRERRRQQGLLPEQRRDRAAGRQRPDERLRVRGRRSPSAQPRRRRPGPSRRRQPLRRRRLRRDLRRTRSRGRPRLRRLRRPRRRERAAADRSSRLPGRKLPRAGVLGGGHPDRRLGHLRGDREGLGLRRRDRQGLEGTAAHRGAGRR